MSETNVHGSIWVLPRIPDLLVNTLPTAGEVCIEQPDDTDEYSFISAYEDKRDGNRIDSDVQAIVEALGAGYTYRYYLECFDDDDPSDRWRVRVTDDRQVVKETPQVIYPGDEPAAPAFVASTANEVNPGDEIEKLAGVGDELYGVLTRLLSQWETTGQSMQDVVPDPGGLLDEGYPLTGSLEEAIASLGVWTERLRGLAAQVSTRLGGTADAIRRHNARIDADIDREPDRYDYIPGTPTNAEIYAGSMRGGMGGVFGDVAASWNPAVTNGVADLLDAVRAGLAHDHPVYVAADKVCRDYLTARERDDNRIY